MKKIDMKTWKRREHFLFFSKMHYPRFAVTLNIDISKLVPYVKERNISLSTALLFLTSKAMNNVEEFRMRIRGDEVVIHDAIHPSLTILTDEDTFHFGEVKFSEDFSIFNENAAKTAQITRETQNLKNEVGRDDYIFTSSLPWFTFTSLTHTITLEKIKLSVPRITWGKYFTQDNKILLPVSLDVNHALIDGVHIGRFVSNLEMYLDDLATYLA